MVGRQKQRAKEPAKNTKDAGDSQLLKQARNELQTLGPTMRTPEEPAVQKRSPSLCLRRRDKKTRSRAALLGSLDESEDQVMQRLDFTGCSDDENDGMKGAKNDENAISSSNVDETTAPTTVRRKLPQSSEPPATAKRKKLPTDAPKKNLKLKRNHGTTEAVDVAKFHMSLTTSSEQLKAPMRNTCILDSPDDKPARKAKRSKSRQMTTEGEETGKRSHPRLT